MWTTALSSSPEARAGQKPRIVTLTLNPAVDIACTAPSVVPTHKIRTADERFDPGGGGINVARVLHALGTDAPALIMTGGVTGQLVEELLDEDSVPWKSLPVSGRTRISLNVHDRQSGLEYRFVAEGPYVSEGEWRGALDALRAVEADWIVASGSLPRGVPASFYADAADIAAGRGQNFVLDTSGEALRAAVGGALRTAGGAGAGHGIALLKLSLGELEFLLGAELRERERQEREIVALQRGGAAQMIAVSLGRDGALLAGANGVVRLPALPVKAESAVGAGDSFLAGLVLGLARGMAEREALALAVAAGSAAVTTYGTALVRREEVEVLFRQLCPDPVGAAAR
jgi:6-phosphofructokinase 2